eukprot:356348-Chlamydomonas_euryale.AAC.2
MPARLPYSAGSSGNFPSVPPPGHASSMQNSGSACPHLKPKVPFAQEKYEKVVDPCVPLPQSAGQGFSPGMAGLVEMLKPGMRASSTMP